MTHIHLEFVIIHQKNQEDCNNCEALFLGTNKLNGSERNTLGDTNTHRQKILTTPTNRGRANSQQGGGNFRSNEETNNSSVNGTPRNASFRGSQSSGIGGTPNNLSFRGNSPASVGGRSRSISSVF